MAKDPLAAADWGLIPPAYQFLLRSYIMRGGAPGRFLTAFLSNDLVGAINAAGRVEFAAFDRMLTFLKAYAPEVCYGSRDRVLRWQELGGLKGEADIIGPAVHVPIFISFHSDDADYSSFKSKVIWPQQRM